MMNLGIGKTCQRERRHLLRPWVIAMAWIGLTAAHPVPLETSAAAGPALTETVAQTASATPIAAVAAFHAALTRGDRDGALALLSEDVVIFENGGVENGRAEYASHHLQADAAFSAAVSRTPIRQTFGEQGDAAWVASTATLSGTFRGRSINSRSIETIQLKRIEGQWRIVHIHWSSADLK